MGWSWSRECAHARESPADCERVHLVSALIGVHRLDVHHVPHHLPRRSLSSHARRSPRTAHAALASPLPCPACTCRSLAARDGLQVSAPHGRTAWRVNRRRHGVHVAPADDQTPAMRRAPAAHPVCVNDAVRAQHGARVRRDAPRRGHVVPLVQAHLRIVRLRLTPEGTPECSAWCCSCPSADCEHAWCDLANVLQSCCRPPYDAHTLIRSMFATAAESKGDVVGSHKHILGGLAAKRIYRAGQRRARLYES